MLTFLLILHILEHLVKEDKKASSEHSGFKFSHPDLIECSIKRAMFSVPNFHYHSGWCQLQGGKDRKGERTPKQIYKLASLVEGCSILERRDRLLLWLGARRSHYFQIGMGFGHSPYSLKPPQGRGRNYLSAMTMTCHKQNGICAAWLGICNLLNDVFMVPSARVSQQISKQISKQRGRRMGNNKAT